MASTESSMLLARGTVVAAASVTIVLYLLSTQDGARTKKEIKSALGP
jgi:hypothetical protein